MSKSERYNTMVAKNYIFLCDLFWYVKSHSKITLNKILTNAYFSFYSL